MMVDPYEDEISVAPPVASTGLEENDVLSSAYYPETLPTASGHPSQTEDMTSRPATSMEMQATHSSNPPDCGLSSECAVEDALDGNETEGHRRLGSSSAWADGPGQVPPTTPDGHAVPQRKRSLCGINIGSLHFPSLPRQSPAHPVDKQALQPSQEDTKNGGGAAAEHHGPHLRDWVRRFSSERAAELEQAHRTPPHDKLAGTVPARRRRSSSLHRWMHLPHGTASEASAQPLPGLDVSSGSADGWYTIQPDTYETVPPPQKRHMSIGDIHVPHLHHHKRATGSISELVAAEENEMTRNCLTRVDRHSEDEDSHGRPSAQETRPDDGVGAPADGRKWSGSDLEFRHNERRAALFF